MPCKQHTLTNISGGMVLSTITWLIFVGYNIIIIYTSITDHPWIFQVLLVDILAGHTIYYDGTTIVTLILVLVVVHKHQV